jgi:hypothetical protein
LDKALAFFTEDQELQYPFQEIFLAAGDFSRKSNVVGAPAQRIVILWLAGQLFNNA